VWCLVCDFNAVRKRYERNGLTQEEKIQGFNTFTRDINLLEILIVGRKFTWY